MKDKAHYVHTYVQYNTYHVFILLVFPFSCTQIFPSSPSSPSSLPHFLTSFPFLPSFLLLKFNSQQLHYHLWYKLPDIDNVPWRKEDKRYESLLPKEKVKQPHQCERSIVSYCIVQTIRYPHGLQPFATGLEIHRIHTYDNIALCPLKMYSDIPRCIQGVMMT